MTRGVQKTAFGARLSKGRHGSGAAGLRCSEADELGMRQRFWEGGGVLEEKGGQKRRRVDVVSSHWLDTRFFLNHFDASVDSVRRAHSLSNLSESLKKHKVE